MKIQQRENTRLRKRARSVGKAAVLQIRGRKIRKKTGAGALLQLPDSRAASVWMQMPEAKKERLLNQARYGAVLSKKAAERQWGRDIQREAGMQDAMLKEEAAQYEQEGSQQRTGWLKDRITQPDSVEADAIQKPGRQSPQTQSTQVQRIQRQSRQGTVQYMALEGQDAAQATEPGTAAIEGPQPVYEGASQNRRLSRRVIRKILRGGGTAGRAIAGQRLQAGEQEEANRQQQKAVRQGTAPVRRAVRRIAGRIGRAIVSTVMAFSPAGILLPIFLILVLVIIGIFGSMQSGSAQATGLSQEVEGYRAAVREVAGQYGMSQYVELILAVMMQESGGQGTDPMQAAEGAYNTRYPHVPNGITDPAYSIACGVQELKNALTLAGVTGSTDMVNIRIALQGYNFGPGYIQWMQRKGYFEWSFGTACEFAAGTGWGQRADPDHPAGPWSYGDQYYPEHVLRYYTIKQGTGALPEGGLPIPVYNQNDYQEPYGRGTIAGYGCGPASFSMVVSYLRNEAISPADVVAWCGNSYYVPGQGTSWNFFGEAAAHYGIGPVTTTTSPEAVLRALQEGRPVISSQGPGLFTGGGHYIVLRGITAEGKILVNDPNDNTQKQYNTRPFDLYAEINSTCRQYWIFEPKR